VIEASPSEHDRQIAVSLALTHFIGRSLAGMGAKPQDIDTEGYKRLLHISRWLKTTRGSFSLT